MEEFDAYDIRELTENARSAKGKRKERLAKQIYPLIKKDVYATIKRDASDGEEDTYYDQFDASDCCEKNNIALGKKFDFDFREQVISVVFKKLVPELEDNGFDVEYNEKRVEITIKW